MRTGSFFIAILIGIALNAQTPSQPVSEPMYERISPDSAVIISYDSAGNAAIAPESEWDSEQDVRGYIRLEVPGTCLAVVHVNDKNDLPKKRLERITRASRFLQIIRSNNDKVVIVSLNDKGQLYISRDGFHTLAEAKARLRDHKGSWVVVHLNQFNRLRPLPEQTDPFSLRLPVQGTITVANGENLCGLFLKPRGLFDNLIIDWVFWYASGGFAVKTILERIELVDNSIQADGQTSVLSRFDEPDEYRVFEKLQNGKMRLVFLGTNLNEAREFMYTRSGLFLLAQQIDCVDTH
ncbi:MAG: hypothetical protein WCA32_23425 [Chromatiaceae bacterium]